MIEKQDFGVIYDEGNHRMDLAMYNDPRCAIFRAICGENDAIFQSNQMIALSSDLKFREAYLPNTRVPVHLGHFAHT